MTIYCDESGGVGAGFMTMAAVSVGTVDADAILDRVRRIIGLRGELKGSRIDMGERAFCVEVLMQAGARVIIASADMAVLRATHAGVLPEDIDIYAALLNHALDAWIAESGGCISIEIDDGRYDPRLNGLLRAEVQSGLGQWGKATLTDSRRSAGIQLADVLANSAYQIGVGSPRAPRIEALLAPHRASGAIRQIEIETIA